MSIVTGSFCSLKDLYVKALPAFRAFYGMLTALIRKLNDRLAMLTLAKAGRTNILYSVKEQLHFYFYVSPDTCKLHVFSGTFNKVS